MKKLFFTFFVATLSVVSAFASEYITLQSFDITWKHSIFSASDVSTKTYDDIKKGYNELSIDITKNSRIAVGTFIITIYNIKGEFVGRKEIEAGDIDKDDYTTFSLTSITGESIGKIYLYYKGSYTIKFRNLVVKKTKDKVYDYDCVIFEDNKEYSYLADISVERNVIYDLPKDISTRTGKLSFAAKRQTSSVIEGEDMSVWVLLKGKDSYQKVSGWNGRDANLSTDYTNYTVLIPHNTISIKFTNGIWNGSLNRYVKDVKVYMDYEYVDTIIWNGTASSDWDNRDNWYKLSGEQLLCADILTEDLTVILPAPNSTNYIVPEGGITRYPVLPDLSTDKKFKNERESLWGGKQVNAGDNATAIEIAHNIYMEDGATLVGVEGLNVNGVSRYTEVERKFLTRSRKEWLLVGSVVNPFVEGTTTPRITLSGDFYLNDLPHVYMHEAIIEDGLLTWDETFSSLKVELVPDKVLAIRVPNQYGGPTPLPAAVYNTENNTTYNGTDPIEYTSRGRFYNESSLPVYDNLEPSKPKFLTNSYPANINAYKLERDENGNKIGTVQYYSYSNKTFIPLGEETDIEISAQHGFLFTPNEGVTTLKVDKSDFNTTKVNLRSAEEEIQSMRLRVENEKKSVASEIYVRYDEYKDDVADYSVDAPKIFNDKQAALPDLYAIRYNQKWSGMSCPTLSEAIPLGINVKAAKQTFKFSLVRSNLPYSVKLEDRSTGMIYNLSEEEIFEVSGLEKGICEGRFYLMFQENEDDVTTDIVEDIESANKIDIFTQGRQVVVSAPEQANLQSVAVYDLSGRLQVYKNIEAGQYVKLDIPLSAGIYTIHAVGASAERVEKIKIN